jgi:hypothetical protein
MDRGALVRRFGFSLIAAAFAVSSAAAGTFGISGRRFTYNSNPEFMVFVSYFAGIRHYAADPAAVIANFNYMRASGVRGIRVFPNWWGGLNPCVAASDTLFSTAHAATQYVNPTQLAHLKNFLTAADNAQLVVDISFAQETVPGLTFTDYKTAIAKVTTELSGGYAHAFIDVQNEANLPSASCNKAALSEAQANELKAAVRGADGTRKVTISIDQNLHGSLAGYLAQVSGFDVAAYHDPRGYPTGAYPANPSCPAPPGNTSPAWVRCTCARVYDVGTGFGNTKPAYFQEPERSNVTAANPTAYFGNPLLEAAARAKISGAAAWTLHTEVGFLLPGFPTALSSVESDFLTRLNATISTVAWNAGSPGYCSSLP